KGYVNYVTGKSLSPISNVLVLPNQPLIDNGMLVNLDKLNKTVSLRGRDLRGAVLMRSDLRKADFTGANLNGANLYSAKLSGAQFDCANDNDTQKGKQRTAAET